MPSTVNGWGEQAAESTHMRTHTHRQWTATTQRQATYLRTTTDAQRPVRSASSAVLRTPAIASSSSRGSNASTYCCTLANVTGTASGSGGASRLHGSSHNRLLTTSRSSLRHSTDVYTCVLCTCVCAHACACMHVAHTARTCTRALRSPGGTIGFAPKTLGLLRIFRLEASCHCARCWRWLRPSPSPSCCSARLALSQQRSINKHRACFSFCLAQRPGLAICALAIHRCGRRVTVAPSH